MRVGGTPVEPGSIHRLSGRVDFVLQGEGKSLPVSYVGSEPLPDTFVDKSQALVEGRPAADGRFVAEHVQAKCASKIRSCSGWHANSFCGWGSSHSALCNTPRFGGGSGDSVDVFGSFALLLAFVCAAYAFVGGIAAIRTRHPLLVKSTRQAGLATCGLIFLATFSLEYLFFSDNFSVAYVVAHSNRSLSPFYKVAALWSGQEGSLLFWSFLLAVYVFFQR